MILTIRFNLINGSQSFGCTTAKPISRACLHDGYANIHETVTTRGALQGRKKKKYFIVMYKVYTWHSSHSQLGSMLL